MPSPCGDRMHADFSVLTGHLHVVVEVCGQFANPAKAKGLFVEVALRSVGVGSAIAGGGKPPEEIRLERSVRNGMPKRAVYAVKGVPGFDLVRLAVDVVDYG